MTRRRGAVPQHPPCFHSPYPAQTPQPVPDTQLPLRGCGQTSVSASESLLSFSFSHTLHPEFCLQDKNGIVVRMRSRSRDDVGTWKTVAWQCEKKSPVGGKSRLLATSTGHVWSVGGCLYSTSRVFSINIYTQTGANTMCRVRI